MLCANPVRLSVPTTAARPAARGALRVQATDKRSRSSLAEVAEFQRSPSDCGSTEVQVALLSSRVTSLTKHLQQNKKDYDTQRGLLQVLGQRKRLLNYMKKSQLRQVRGDGGEAQHPRA